MKNWNIIALCICIVVLVTACSQRGDTKESEISQSQPIKEQAERDVPDAVASIGTYDSVLALYKDNELVKDNAFAKPLENVALLDEWVENYRQGIPGKIAILHDGMGFPSGLTILESDGSATYTITEYSSAFYSGESVQRPPQVFTSSCVVKREYDYVFGADFPADILRNVFVIHRREYPTVEEMKWNPATDSKFERMNFEQAEQTAQEVEERIYRHISVISNTYAGGIYLRDSILQSAEKYEPPEVFYKVTRAIRIDGEPYYVVYGNADKEALERGEHGGSVVAVRSKRNLVFIQSMVGGEWIFVDDAGQEVIAP